MSLVIKKTILYKLATNNQHKIIPEGACDVYTPILNQHKVCSAG